MRLVTMRALLCLAALGCYASNSLAEDSYFSANSAGLGGVDFSTSSTALSNNAVDQLLNVNATGYSVARSGESTAIGIESMAPVVSSTSEAKEAPIIVAEEAAPTSVRSGTYVLGACCAMFAVGLGLCCAGMMSTRQRTLNTFSAGFSRLK